MVTVHVIWYVTLMILFLHLLLTISSSHLVTRVLFSYLLVRISSSPL